MESKTQVRKTVVRKETEFIADGCDGLLDLLQVFCGEGTQGGGFLRIYARW